METSQSSFNADQYWQILKRRWRPGLAVLLAISSLGIISTALKPDIYQAQAKLRFKKSNAISALTDISPELGALAPLADKSNPINTEAEVIQSDPVIRKTINDLNLKNEEGNLLQVPIFLEKLRVSEVTGTDVLKLTYQDVEAQKSAEIINTLIANYLGNNITANRTEALEARKFLEEQIPKAEKELLETETSIKEFKINNQIIAPEEEAAMLVKTLGDIDKQVAEARGEVANIANQSQYLKEKLNMTSNQALAATTVSQSPVVRQIVTDLKDLIFELNQEKSRFTDDHPRIIELEEEIRLQENLLNEQVRSLTGYNQQKANDSQFGPLQQDMTAELIKLESTNLGLNQQIDYLTELQRQLQQKAANLPELEQRLKQLLRQSAVSQQTYELLQNQLALIEVTANQNIGNVRVISYATVPEKPVSSRSVGYLAAIGLGLISAAGIMYLLESRDRSLKTVEEAKKLFGYNWLGIIPSFDKTQMPTLEDESKDIMIPPLIVKDYPGSSFSESYRMLQSNIRFLNSDRQIQTIVVTSSVAKEGKSTVAANLAGAMAQVGHKVLLVDADLHNPQQQHIWNTYSDHGLSNLLAENLDSQLATETVMKNLNIISSGVIPPSPGTLLDSYQMKDLMYYWSRVYDFIIIDSPALATAADAPILGRMADGVLLVVKPEKVTHSRAKLTKDTLERSGQNVLGIVFNDINPKFDPSAHYYHPLEGQQSNNALPEGKSLNSGEQNEELWQTISRLSRQQESPKLQFDSEVNREQLLDIPLEQLEENIRYLQKDLDDLTNLVKEQEDELFAKRQAVRKLQRKVNLATVPDRFALEQELAQEQEMKKMLDETLVGQRRNLSRKRQILRQYQEALEIKQV